MQKGSPGKYLKPQVKQSLMVPRGVEASEERCGLCKSVAETQVFSFLEWEKNPILYDILLFLLVVRNEKHRQK